MRKKDRRIIEEELPALDMRIREIESSRRPKGKQPRSKPSPTKIYTVIARQCNGIQNALRGIDKFFGSR